MQTNQPTSEVHKNVFEVALYKFVVQQVIKQLNFCVFQFNWIKVLKKIIIVFWPRFAPMWLFPKLIFTNYNGRYYQRKVGW